ncbi:MAG: hypothetical protein R3F34_16925 [Planctomycetota bacterium]
MRTPLLLALAMLLAAPTAGCGTLMFPERSQLERSNRADPNIVLLDALGLLVFVAPGVISFVVDFTSGAIYLPQGVEHGEGPFFRDAVESSDGAADEGAAPDAAPEGAATEEG